MRGVINGNILADVSINGYKGLETETAKVTINNAVEIKTIAVDVKQNVLEAKQNKIEYVEMSVVEGKMKPSDLNILCTNMVNSIVYNNHLYKFDKLQDNNIYYNNIDNDHMFRSIIINTETKDIDYYQFRISDGEDIEEQLEKEITRAKNAEQVLTTNLNQEIEDRIAADELLETAINDEITRAENSEAELQANLDEVEDNLSVAIYNESERAKEVEDGLAESISQEQTRATNKEDEISADLEAENSRATQAEQDLANGVAAEVTRATGEEGRIDVKLDTEIQDRKNDVDAEELRAKNAETQLGTDLSTEITRATNAESGLSSRIDNLSTSLTQETQNRQFADETLTTNLNTEIGNRTNADATLQGNIDSEAAARANADSTLQDNIDAEEERALLAEETLTTSVNNINLKIPDAASENNQLADKEFVTDQISTNTATFRGTYNSIQDLPADNIDNNDYAFVISTDASGNTLYNRYKYVSGTGWVFEYALNNSSFNSDQWAAINSNITAELTAQITANENAIDAEASAARLAEEQLQTNINTVSGNLDTETLNRTTVDTNLQNQINTLSGSLSSETIARSTKDSELETAISNEVNRAQTVESGLSSDIDDYSFKNTTNQNIETWVEYAKDIVWPQEINN